MDFARHMPLLLRFLHINQLLLKRFPLAVIFRCHVRAQRGWTVRWKTGTAGLGLPTGAQKLANGRAGQAAPKKSMIYISIIRIVFATGQGRSKTVANRGKPWQTVANLDTIFHIPL